jgi:hypothetical protein
MDIAHARDQDITITPEIVELIAEIDEFKGALDGVRFGDSVSSFSYVTEALLLGRYGPKPGAKCEGSQVSQFGYKFCPGSQSSFCRTLMSVSRCDNNTTLQICHLDLEVFPLIALTNTSHRKP